MATAIYVGINSKAKKIKAAYFGINGVAKKIKKIYVGVNNTAKKIFESSPIIRIVTNMVAASNVVAAGNVSNYAIFAPNGNTANRTVAYNASLTRTSPLVITISSPASASSAYNNQYYAYFMSNNRYIFSYDSSLTRRQSSNTLNVGNMYSAATNNGTTTNAIFAGGYMRGNTITYNKGAYITTSSGTLTNVKDLSKAVARLTATTINGHSLLAGGSDDTTAYETINVYDGSSKNLNKNLSVARAALASANNGTYALFGGGYNGSTYYNTVDAFDSSLTRTTPSTLSFARASLAATVHNNCILFGGGTNGSIYYDIVDCYDSSLTKTLYPALSLARSNLGATYVGSYALFAGGYNGNSSDVVDAYRIA